MNNKNNITNKRICPICDGYIRDPKDDICCVKEDQFLLVHAQRYIYLQQQRQCHFEDLITYLYDRLEEFYRAHQKSIDNYDENQLIKKIEKRIMKWVRDKTIRKRSVVDIAFCAKCGKPIIGFRKTCAMCYELNDLKQSIQNKRNAIKKETLSGSNMVLKKNPIYMQETVGKYKKNTTKPTNPPEKPKQ